MCLQNVNSINHRDRIVGYGDNLLCVLTENTAWDEGEGVKRLIQHKIKLNAAFFIHALRLANISFPIVVLLGVMITQTV